MTTATTIASRAPAASGTAGGEPADAVAQKDVEQVEADIAPFRAGQFTRLALEIDGEMVARPYSFVNGPDNPLHEFYFITVPDGPLTRELVRLQPGDGLEPDAGDGR